MVKVYKSVISYISQITHKLSKVNKINIKIINIFALVGAGLKIETDIKLILPASKLTKCYKQYQLCMTTIMIKSYFSGTPLVRVTGDVFCTPPSTLFHTNTMIINKILLFPGGHMDPLLSDIDPTEGRRNCFPAATPTFIPKEGLSWSCKDIARLLILHTVIYPVVI